MESSVLGIKLYKHDHVSLKQPWERMDNFLRTMFLWGAFEDPLYGVQFMSYLELMLAINRLNHVDRYSSILPSASSRFENIRYHAYGVVMYPSYGVSIHRIPGL